MSFDWTSERVEKLKSLWGDGHTASEIVAFMGSGCTRSAILGKVFRLRLPTRSSGGGGREVPKARKRLSPEYVIGHGSKVKPEPVKVAAPAEGDPSNPWRAFEGDGVNFMKLEAGQCKWPICKTGDDGIEMACGCPVKVDSKYCAWHAQASIGTLPKRRTVLAPAGPKNNARMFG